MQGVRIGKNVYAGRGLCLSKIYSLTLGDNIYIGKNVTIEIEGVIGSNVVIANNVGVVGRYDHDISDPDIPIFFAPGVRDRRSLSRFTTIEDNVWIGFGSVILSGVRIGTGSVIAAGSVVIEDIPEYAIVAGSPARVVSYRRNVDGV
jgi:acetyltransferase-like isoleucine patch superfamily enzyme